MQQRSTVNSIWAKIRIRQYAEPTTNYELKCLVSSLPVFGNLLLPWNPQDT